MVSNTHPGFDRQPWGAVHNRAPACLDSVLQCAWNRPCHDTSRNPCRNFPHPPVDVATLGNAVTMTTVRRADIVGALKVLADTDGDGFFTAVKVNEAWNIAGGTFLVKAHDNGVG